MRRHGPVIVHCTDSEDFPKHHPFYFSVAIDANYIKVVEDRPIMSKTKMQCIFCDGTSRYGVPENLTTG